MGEKLMRSLNVKSVTDTKPWVLLVDDEAFNLEILEELLTDYGYQTDCAENGREACELLLANPDKYSVVLLDRMMPEMGGMEVTEFMKLDPQLRKIPIVMQSAKAAKQDIEEGLNAGILYYLTKPFGKNELLSIVDTATRYFAEYQDLLVQLSQDQSVSEWPGAIELRTIDEARSCAISLAKLAQDPERIVIGLYELIVNGVEHGNLGIDYQQKSGMQDPGVWFTEIEKRMALPENKNKKVTIECTNEQGELVIKITDQGSGFDYREFLEMTTFRSLKTTGRGIAIAKVLCFDHLDYVAPGNQVIVRTKSKTNSDEGKN